MNKLLARAKICAAAAVFVLCLALLGVLSSPVHAETLPALHAGSQYIRVTEEDGKYHVRGSAEGMPYVYFDKIEVPEDGKIYISLDLNEYPYAEDVDTWLSFLVGTDQGVKFYGPNTVYADNYGPYYSQLMRVGRNGTINGDYFYNGVVQGSFATIGSVHVEICLQYSGSRVQVYTNGTATQSFTAQDAENCYISFVQHCAVSSRIYDYTVYVGRAAQGSDAEYDLSVGGDTLAIPLKNMGSEVTGLKSSDGTALSEGTDYTIEQSEGGIGSILLKTSLFGQKEGETTRFTLVSTGGESVFTVTTADNTVAQAEDASVDKAEIADLTLPLHTGNLQNVTLEGENGERVEEAVLTADSVTFPKEYLDTLGYGEHTYFLRGQKQSGILSAVTEFTVTVFDSRLPAFGAAETEIDAAALEGDVALDFSLYDATLSKVLLNGKIVSSGDYRLEGESLVLDRAWAETVLAYGENTLSVVTDKGEASVKVVKTDSRTPAVSEEYVVDLSAADEYITLLSSWYDEAPDRFELNGSEVDPSDWEVTLRGVRVRTEVFRAMGTGSGEGAFYVGETAFGFTLVRIDTAAPEVVRIHHYDAAYGYDAEIVFDVKACAFSGIRLNGAAFGVALFEGDTLRIPAAWFAEKVARGDYGVGDTITFTAVWSNAFVPEGIQTEVQVRILDSREELASLQDFDKKSGEGYLVPVLLNGYAVRSVQVNGAYTLEYTIVEGGLEFSAEFIRGLAVGALQFTIETERYTVTCSNQLSDTRSAQITGSGNFCIGKEYPEGFLFGMQLYENSIYFLSDWEGKTIAAYNYRVTEDGILFDGDWLSGMGAGYFNFSVVTQRREGGMTVQETVRCALYIDDAAAAEVTAESEYDLSSGEEFVLHVDFKENRFAGISCDGAMLPSYSYKRVTGDQIILYPSSLQALGTGTKTFALVCDKSETPFTVEIADTRLNTFALQELAVNAGERSIVLYGELTNRTYTLTVDGESLGDGDFEVDGNYILLSAAFVKGLAPGAHEVKMTTAGGESVLTLQILDNRAEYTLPVLLTVGISVIVFGGTVLLLLLPKRKKTEKTGDRK